MMYKCKYFAIQELAHPWILNKIGETNTWLRLDEDVLRDEGETDFEKYAVKPGSKLFSDLYLD